MCVQGLKGNTQLIVSCVLWPEKGLVGEKIGLPFKGEGSCGMLALGHSSLHFSATSCMGRWHPRNTLTQQVFIERCLCSGLHARFFGYTLPACIR